MTCNSKKLKPSNVCGINNDKNFVYRLSQIYRLAKKTVRSHFLINKKTTYLLIFVYF